ncbi:MAG: hypothetical protein OIN89_04655 [Candidatus Methanoperedens sp.]|jgi:uncharacterized membrane protein YoaK (UPF0700 family)|nr:hypothetical protein [Candidatus Methanoperedens sp.]
MKFEKFEKMMEYFICIGAGAVVGAAVSKDYIIYLFWIPIILYLLVYVINKFIK